MLGPSDICTSSGITPCWHVHPHSYSQAVRSRTDGRLAITRDAVFEQIEIVADGHGEGQQFLESLLRFVKLDRDASWFEADTVGEVLKFLIHDGRGGFDQQLRLSDPL